VLSRGKEIKVITCRKDARKFANAASGSRLFERKAGSSFKVFPALGIAF
jgi:hypothetical protein